MTRVRSERGFTLVEVLVVMVLGIVVLGAGVDALVSFLGQSAAADRRSDMQDIARNALDQMATQMRSAMATGPGGTPPVEQVSDYSVVFLAPGNSVSLTNNPAGLQHVRYCLSMNNLGNESLWLQTAPYNTSTNRNWPSTGSCPASAWPTQTPLADHFVNGVQSPAVPMFIPTTDSTGTVTDLVASAWVDMDPTQNPPATNLKTGVAFRNVNHPPSASVSCQPTSSGHVLCDASASSDPDGQTLSYSWTVDGVASGTTSYKLDQGNLASGSTHTFQVTVADSGGVTASASQQVKMP